MQLRHQWEGRRRLRERRFDFALKRGLFSQHDQNLANASGAAFRSDLNNALGALFGLSSGSSAPSTTIAYQLWADTTNAVLKQRNAANSAWLVRGTLTEDPVVARSSNVILGVSDYGRVVSATSTFTQTLTAAATLGDGWWCGYVNTGTGVITIDPNSTETINGLTSIVMSPGDSCLIYCDGSNFISIGLGRSTVRRKTADESVTSSTTRQDDDHLTFPIPANSEWIVQCALDVVGNLGLHGLSVSVNAPAGATMESVISGTNDTGTRATGVDSALTLSAALFTAGNGHFHLDVWILNGATAGSVTLKWAQATSNAQSLTLKKGSSMRAHRVP